MSPPTPSQARGRERRATIVAAAATVLVRDGLRAVTHRAVAREAGVPLGSTTYYVADRDELVREALGLLVDQERARRGAVAPGPDGDVAAAARAVVDLLLPPDLVASGRAALVHERLTECAADPRTAALVAADLGALRADVARVLAPAGLADDAAVVLPLVDGRALHRLAESPGATTVDDLVAVVADDLRRLSR